MPVDAVVAAVTTSGVLAGGLNGLVTVTLRPVGAAPTHEVEIPTAELNPFCPARIIVTEPELP